MSKANGAAVGLNYHSSAEPEWFVYYDGRGLAAASEAVLAEALEWFADEDDEDAELPDRCLFSIDSRWGRLRPITEDDYLDDGSTHVWEESLYPEEGFDRVLRARYLPWVLRDQAELKCRDLLVSMAVWLVRARFGPDVIIKASKAKDTFGTADRRAFDGKTPFGIRFDFPRPERTKDGIRLSEPVLFYDVNNESLTCSAGMSEEWNAWWPQRKAVQAAEERKALLHWWHRAVAQDMAMGSTDVAKWEMMLIERRLEKLKPQTVSA